MIDKQHTAISQTQKGALSHPVNVLRLSQKGQNIKLSPNPDTLAALAQELELVSIESLNALLLVKRWHKDGVRVSGTIDASLTQSCIATLIPVAEKISAEFNAVYVPAGSKLARPVISGDANELVIDPDGEDLPEVFELPELDVGLVVSEFLALEINPYPKSEGADQDAPLSAQPVDEETDNIRENPFAALSALKDKL